MPTVQLPIISANGVANGGDTGSGFAPELAPYPFFLNGYFEKTDSQVASRAYAYIKRSGLRIAYSGFSNNSKVLGTLSSPDRAHYYCVTGISGGAVSLICLGTALTALSTTIITADGWTKTGPIVFTNLDANQYNNFSVAFTDFTKGGLCQADGSGYALISDTDFTGLTKVTPFVALDGYLFIGTSNGRIYNSDLNQPTSWTATSFLAANDYPGKITWLGRLRNYLICFKEHSIEFFEDVGLPTPGSPLLPRKQLNRKIGCILPSTIQEVSDGIIFAGTSTNGSHRMYKLDRDTLELRPISNRIVEQGLTIYSTTTAFSNDATNAGIYQAQSQTFVYAGKEFYTVNVAMPISNSFTSSTLVYDNDLGIWTNFASSLTTQFTSDAYGFSPSQARYLYSSSNFGTISLFVDNKNSGASAPPRLLYMPDPAITFSASNYSDVGNGYEFAWTSDPLDFGSRKRKFMDRIEFYYTSIPNSSPTNNPTTILSLKYRDYDYNPNNVTARTLPIDDGGGVRCKTHRLGQFRRRVFTLKDERNFASQGKPLVLYGYEIQYNNGEIDQDS